MIILFDLQRQWLQGGWRHASYVTENRPLKDCQGMSLNKWARELMRVRQSLSACVYILLEHGLKNCRELHIKCGIFQFRNLPKEQYFYSRGSFEEIPNIFNRNVVGKNIIWRFNLSFEWRLSQTNAVLHWK